MATLPFPSEVIDFAGIYQRIADFRRVRDDGVRKAVLRMGDGRTQDPYFLYNLDGSALLPEKSEAYWQFRPSLDPVYHAEAMYVALAGADWPVDILWLACEAGDGLGSQLASARLDKTVALFEAAVLGRVEICPYTSRTKWGYTRYSTFLRNRKLWVADYGIYYSQPVYPSYCPRLPAGCTTWHRWQKWSKGKVDGINGNVDLNDEQAAA